MCKSYASGQKDNISATSITDNKQFKLIKPFLCKICHKKTQLFNEIKHF